MTTSDSRRVLVTGGGGFLGGMIVDQLLERGDTVRSVARGDYPALRDKGVETLRGDLSQADVAATACEGMDLVIHVAAKAGVWGPLREYRAANVESTRHIIAGCRSAGVKALVVTSSPSAVFAGIDLVNADESTPFPSSRKFLNNYSRTKAEAEQLALAANGAGLATCALRPHLILGKGDPHLIPRLIERAAKRKLMRVGTGVNEVGFTWVVDAARAHLLAADRLLADGTAAACAGKPYFITQGEGTSMWGWIANVIERLGLPPIRKTVSLGFAWRMGSLMETAFRLFRIRSEPPITRFVAAQMARHHHFRIDAARRDLGYEPSITIARLTDKVVEYLQAERAET